MWYMNSVIYGVDIERFVDANGNGVGDFIGLTSRLDYLQDLGINCLWIMPFFESPHRDNGYDITNYCKVNPRLGTMEDFDRFLEEAHRRNIRVIIDLVANHTSDQHPWFQEARSNPKSKYRDYYVWSNEPIETDASPIFPGEEDSVWTYDEVAKQYYWHVFYHFQPGLNHWNPEVRKEFHDIARFWLDRGVDGFRIDAAPHLIRKKGIPNTHDTYDHGILRELHEVIDGYHEKPILLLGESDAEPEELVRYFGNGDELNMLFNFYVNNFLYLAFATEEASPILHALKKLPAVPERCQWANFLRNVDELDLERLSKEQRQKVFAEFAPQENMRIYNRGIRRRLPPMFSGDIKRIKMAFSLMFSLPGVPLVIYGEEIGMGDMLELEGRNSVRTAMQWADDKFGGFTDSDHSEVPVIDSGPYGYQKINVADQQKKPESLLNWMKQLIDHRQTHNEMAFGKHDIYELDTPEILAHYYVGEQCHLTTLHNLSNESITLHMDNLAGQTSFFGDGDYKVGADGKIELRPYAYAWFKEEA